jgi:hypothetical protein
MLIDRGLISFTSFIFALCLGLFAGGRTVSDLVGSVISITALSAKELGLTDLAAAFELVSVSLLSIPGTERLFTMQAASRHAYVMKNKR